jgi:hypothetical protein
LPAEDAAAPVVTLLTASRALSKLRSKFTAETSAPFWEDKLTGTLMPLAPGSPDPFPTESTA